MPVGSYPAGASSYSVMDMSGNVWEWVADVYDPEYYANSPAENPTGPEGGSSMWSGWWILWKLDIFAEIQPDHLTLVLQRG